MTKVLKGLAGGGFLAVLLVALASMWMLISPRDGPPIEANTFIVQSMHADTQTSGILQSNEGPVVSMDLAMSSYDVDNHQPVARSQSTILSFSNGPPGYFPAAFYGDIDAVPNTLDAAHSSSVEFQFSSPSPGPENGVLTEVASSPAIFTSWISVDEAFGSHLYESRMSRLQLGSGIPLFLLFGVILALIVVVPFGGTSSTRPSRLFGAPPA